MDEGELPGGDANDGRVVGRMEGSDPVGEFTTDEGDYVWDITCCCGFGAGECG